MSNLGKLARELDRKEEEERIKTTVSLSPPGDHTWEAASEQLLCYTQVKGWDPVTLKPILMSAAMEGACEGTIVSGYLNKTLRVTSVKSFKDIVLDDHICEAEAALSKRSVTLGSSGYGDRELLKRISALPRPLVDELVLASINRDAGIPQRLIKAVHMRMYLDHQMEFALRELVKLGQEPRAEQSQEQHHGHYPKH